MTLLKIHMTLFGWYYAWKTKRDTVLKSQIRSKEEVVLKKKEFESKFLLASKSGNEEANKYRYYTELLKWVLKEL